MLYIYIFIYLFIYRLPRWKAQLVKNSPTNAGDTSDVGSILRLFYVLFFWPGSTWDLGSLTRN